MDSSLAALTARPRPFEIEGRTYQLHPPRLNDIGEMQAFCDARMPNPYKSVSEQLGKGIFTVAQERALLDAAVRVASGPRPQIGSPECDAILGTIEGFAKFVHLSIRQGDPKFTEADALALVRSLDLARTTELDRALGFEQLIGGEEEGSSGPKAGPGGGSSTPP